MNLPKRLTLWVPHATRNAARATYDVAVRRLKKRSGDVVWDKRLIRLAPAPDRTTLATLLHEAFHIASPDSDETVILRLEWNALAVLDACLKGQRWPSR